ncbi:hypothetical protein JKP88DRAFT_354120 [Tribonema minus]|uniref:Tubulin--tyrosine ligase n=1 Tax=Tribonema minus TaxID=303371 RepID=A0A835Z2B8_9STRA|nr:hypothetical protein JKP88DRAFT_354120 [Tribonema minus]
MAALEERLRRLRYRVTGAGAVSRIRPVLDTDSVCREGCTVEWQEASSPDERLDFVYETTVTKDWQAAHRGAVVLNRLCGSVVLEDKASFALLSRRMAAPALESHLVEGSSGVEAWAKARWGPLFNSSSSGDEGGSGAEGNDSSSSGAAACHRCGSREPVGDSSTDGAAACAAGSLSSGAAAARARCRGAPPREPDWWCVKAARGNGGGDVWVLHAGNAQRLVAQLSRCGGGGGGAYVLQRYVARPLLLPRCGGAKSHFRCFGVLRGDLSAWLHAGACVLRARAPYALSDAGNPSIHLTNLAFSKRPGGAAAAAAAVAPGADGAAPPDGSSSAAAQRFRPQTACDLPREHPALWPRMLAAWGAAAAAAAPLMRHQASAAHFALFGLDFLADAGGELSGLEFLADAGGSLFGLDFLADAAGGVWLLEANRVPGLASTRENWAEDEAFYGALTRDLLDLAVLPHVACGALPHVACGGAGGGEGEGEGEGEGGGGKEGEGEDGRGQRHGFVRAAPVYEGVVYDAAQVWRNVFNLAAFARRCRAEDAAAAAAAGAATAAAAAAAVGEGSAGADIAHAALQQ